MAITLGGGGSASQVNETVDINSAENLITLDDGRVYLKGGVTEADLTTYPDATTSLGYSTTSFSAAGQMADVQDITWDGSHFFVLAWTANSVYKYTSAGVYTGTSYSLASSGLTQPTGITWDGTYFWIASTGNNKVFKFNASFVYQSFSFNIASRTTDPSGITYDGTHLWLIGTNGNLSKWTTSGTDTGVNFSVAAQENNPKGVAWDGTHVWIAGSQHETGFQYTTAGSYTGLNFSAASQSSNTGGLLSVGNAFWVLDQTSKAAYKYAPQIGVVANHPNNVLKGLQNYVRIK